MSDIMTTYKELMAVKYPVTGAELFFEYVSKYRRVTMVLDGSTWCLRVSYKGMASELKSWEKTYGDKAICAAWTLVQVKNRDISLGILTIKEAPGKVIIDRIPL